MYKLVVAIYRKPGMTLEEFNDRWFNGHGPLVRKHAAAMRIKRYVQSHYEPAPDLEHAWMDRGWTERPDALTETWWERKEDLMEALATPEGQIANKELEADEAEFCDMDRVMAFMSTEKVII